MTDLQSLDINRLQQEEARAQNERMQISSEFIEAHMSIVESLARNLINSKLPPGITLSDLVSAGTEGLIKAKKGFDDKKGTRFSTYAYYRIRGEMMDFIRREWTFRNPVDYRSYQEKIQKRIAEVTQTILDSDDGTVSQEKQINDIITSSEVAYVLSLDDVLNSQDTLGDNAVTPEDEIERLQSMSLLWKEVRELSDEEKQVIELFYVYGISQKEIADRLGMSKSKVCRIHLKALERLKKQLSKQFR